MPLAASTRYVRYDPVVSTTEFDVPFPLFDNDDLSILVNSAATTAYTVTATYENGRSDDAVITLNSAANGVPVEIYGQRVPRSENDYLASGSNLAEKVARDIEAVTATQQEQERDFGTSIKLPFDETIEFRIAESAASRANKMVGFDGLGNPIATDAVSLNPISAATQAALDTLAAGGGLQWGDDVKLELGDAQEAAIFYSGSGDALIIQAGSITIRSETGGDTFFFGQADGASAMYYNGLERFGTRALGVNVVGQVDADTIAGDWIASQAEAEAGTATDKVMTPERTKEAVEALSLGGGQTWDNTAGGLTRVANTWYTNNTGRTIFVVIEGDSSNGQISVSPDGGTTVIRVGQVGQSPDYRAGASFPVPDGYSYRCSNGFATWAELR